tara:strand:- start:2355 stop:2969 length:615 start_codon:yes stop_codon:yes gene_type:complete
MAITNFAQDAFRSSGDQLLVPRQKFNFTLVVDIFDQASKTFTRVSNASAASYSVDTQLMNQYNKKRVVQTRLNYEPITVAFYDTFDSEWSDLMRDYLAHYFNGGNGIENRTNLEGSSTVDPNFETDLGFTPNADRYFFPSIRIIQNGYRDQYRETKLINPTITNMQGDALDYSDSNPVMYTVTFQPESIQVEEVRPTVNPTTAS